MTSKMLAWKIQPDLARFKTIQNEAVGGVLFIAFTQGFFIQYFLSPWINIQVWECDKLSGKILNYL